MFNVDMSSGGLNTDSNRNSTSCPPPPIPPNVPVGGPLPGNPNLIIMQQIEGLNGQQNVLREQIAQSEQNLQAQHTVSSINPPLHYSI